jgi:hypothetical protein
MAVIAHVRHTETGYDELLGSGSARHEARAMVADTVDQVLARWRGSGDAGD